MVGLTVRLNGHYLFVYFVIVGHLMEGLCAAVDVFDWDDDELFHEPFFIKLFKELVVCLYKSLWHRQIFSQFGG